MTSPKQLAQQLEVPLEETSYHVRQLCELDVIQPAHTATVRGAIEHFYRSRGRPRIDEATWERLPQIVREAVQAAALSEIFSGFVDRTTDGRVEQVRCRELCLDGRGYSEAHTAMRQLSRRLTEIENRANTRISSGSAVERVVDYVGMLYAKADSSPR